MILLEIISWLIKQVFQIVVLFLPICALGAILWGTWMLLVWVVDSPILFVILSLAVFYFGYEFFVYLLKTMNRKLL
jgi:hypothetical protein